MTNTPSAIVMAAGQGIGAGIARHLHSVGYRLVLLAISDDDLRGRCRRFR